MNKKIILISGISVIVLAGLISFFLLKDFSQESKESIEEEILESTEKYIAAKSGLNMRSNPSKSASVVSLIPFGAKVKIEKSEGDEIFLDGRYGKWVNVKYGNKTGWLFSGFLCDFEPNSVIKPVADHYREFNVKEAASESCLKNPDDCIHYMDDKISIENIAGNYIALSIPYTNYDGGNSLGIVWRYDTKQKKFFEVYSGGIAMHLFYLDNDKYPDLFVEFDSSYGGTPGISILLGSKEGAKKIFEWDHSYDLWGFTLGSCGDMKFARKKIDYGKKKDNEIAFFRFNCDKRKVEKYDEKKVFAAYGKIQSIDLKNMSIIVNDEKDESYKFSAKTNVFSGMYSAFYKINHKVREIKDLKKGDRVTLLYEVNDEKKLISIIKKHDH